VSDCGKFYCGRKGKFGLNMQGVCDARRHFIDISIRNPASASDFLSYATSNLYGKVSTPGFLAPGLSLYGDKQCIRELHANGCSVHGSDWRSKR